MKPSPHSLRSKLLTVILLCWVVPVMVLIALTVLFLGREYRRTARSILETDAAGALRQTELLFSQAFNASKEVTYDGVILSAYRAYQESKDASSLYRTATDYLAQVFPGRIPERRIHRFLGRVVHRPLCQRQGLCQRASILQLS